MSKPNQGDSEINSSVPLVIGEPKLLSANLNLLHPGIRTLQGTLLDPDIGLEDRLSGLKHKLEANP